MPVRGHPASGRYPEPEDVTRRLPAGERLWRGEGRPGVVGYG